MNPLYAIALTALAGLAATTAIPAQGDDPNCVTLDNGFVCVEADTDCTDGSCGANVDAEVGAAQSAASRANCVDANGMGNVCADAGTGGASVDVTYNVPDVASGELHAGVGIGTLR